MESYLASALKSICNGYTVGTHKKRSIFFKHFSLMDHVDIESKHHEALEWAKSKGLPTEKEQLEFCIKENLWSTEKENEIEDLRASIKNTRQFLNKAMLGVQKNELKSNLDSFQERLGKLLLQRGGVIGTTANDIATRRANDYYIYKSCFSDVSLLNPLYSEEEFEYIEQAILQELINEHNLRQKEVNSEIIKKIVISPFFMTLYRLVKDPHSLFDRPILNLTYVQIEFLNFAELFKRIFSESDVPESLKDDPDKIIEWFNSKDTAKGAIERAREINKHGGAVAIVGASKEELNNAGIKDGIDLHKEIRKKKGQLNQDEMIKLLGL